MSLFVEIFLLLLSLLLGALPLYVLRRHDIHDPEPFPILIGTALVGGFVSSAFTLAVFWAAGEAGLEVRPASLHSFLLIGPVEELAKLFGYLAAHRLFREYFDEPVDCAIYMGAVAIGFSAIENASYAAGAQQSGWLLVLRLLVATPVHVVWSLFVGLGIAHAERLGRPGPVLRALAIAALLHGLWDFAAFRLWPWALLHIFFVFLFFRGRFILTYLLADSHLRPRFGDDLTGAAPVPVAVTPPCPACASERKATAQRLRPGMVYTCAHCGWSFVTRQTLYDIFHYYGSLMQGLWLRWRRTTDEHGGLPEHGRSQALRTLIAGNYLSTTGLAFFRPHELDAALEDVNRRVVERYRRLWLRV